MRTGEVLLIPRCVAAENATYCWHDVIKNRIQSFSDPFLERWLHDPESVSSFEATLEHVVVDLEGFSLARAVEKLAPIAGMAEIVRRELEIRLHDAFQRDFCVSELQERLRTVVDSLKNALHECRSAQTGADKRERLARVRMAATAVRHELEALPAGFWIPPQR